MELALNKLAYCQKRPRLLGRQRLAMNRTEPAEPHQLCDAARILAVGLPGIALKAFRT
jgi:hypothetical protein